jgi:hypothetical protein
LAEKIIFLGSSKKSGLRYETIAVKQLRVDILTLLSKLNLSPSKLDQGVWSPSERQLINMDSLHPTTRSLSHFVRGCISDMMSPEESHGITGTIILMAYARQTKISAAHKIFGMSCLSPDIKTWLIAAIIENKGLSSHKSHCS